MICVVCNKHTTQNPVMERILDNVGCRHCSLREHMHERTFVLSLHEMKNGAEKGKSEERRRERERERETKSAVYMLVYVLCVLGCCVLSIVQKHYFNNKKHDT